MSEAWNDFPFAITYLLFLCVITLRAHGTYWLARGVTSAAMRAPFPEGSKRARINHWLTNRVEGTGTRAIERYGLVVIPLAHLTVGLQTLVLAGAGILRVTWWKFSIAQLIGGLAWALIYTTVGMAAWWAAVATIAGAWWVAVIVVVVVIAAVVFVVVRRRSARARQERIPVMDAARIREQEWQA